MNELRQPHVDSQSAKTKDRLIAVRVAPDDVRYFTNEEELDAAISQDTIQRGLDLAGAWGDLDVSEDELLRALDEIRHESEPTPSLTLGIARRA